MRLKILLLSLFIAVSTISAEVNIGTTAPDFTLTSVEGEKVSLSNYKGKIVVLEWFNMGCPFVKKHYRNQDMQNLQADYTSKGIIWLTINSTNPSHKDYLNTAKASEQVKQLGIRATAMLQDSDGKVGRLYEAKATPHLFVISADGKLAYQGAIDDQPSPNADPKKSKNYVRTAVNQLLEGKPVSESQTKQYGCSIKYAD